jgi:Spy/CpxP family protein refolding chaperone
MIRQFIAPLFIPALFTLALTNGFQLFAQELATPPLRQLKGPGPSAIYDDSQPSPAQDFQMLRKDLRSQKKQSIAANMDLTDSEAEKFWPVYDRYATDLAKIYDVKLELVAEFLDNYKTMNGDQAESYIRRRAAVEQDVMALRVKYVPEFRRVLSGRQAALFFQIEWRLDLMINLQLAEMPLIDP